MAEPWTPGPWTWEDPKLGADYPLFDGSWLYPGVLCVSEPPTPADARLIALAPEMAELLASYLADAESRAYPDEDGGAILIDFKPLRDLLARARGEA